MTTKQRYGIGTVAWRLLVRLSRQRRGVGLLVAFSAIIGALALAGNARGVIPLPTRPGDTVATDRADTFMRALRDRDGAALWASMDEQLRVSLVGHAGVPQTQQAELALARVVAERSSVSTYHEVAEAPLKQGGAVHLFIATVKAPSGAESDVPFTLTVESDGLVSKVE
ncbi:MAG: hypothetical protein IT307_06630 [Chloroflexi bacterium]|nr:hypothetical protein [Chloroflexota bacterium]